MNKKENILFQEFHCKEYNFCELDFYLTRWTLHFLHCGHFYSLTFYTSRFLAISVVPGIDSVPGQNYFLLRMSS